MRHLPLDHPGTADHRSPARFLWWLVTGQWRTIVVGMLLGITWMLCQAVMPAVVGRAIDRGVTAEDTTALVQWTGLMLGIGVVQAAAGIMRHRFAVTNWLTAAYRVVQLVTRQATRLGSTLPKRVATGEVVAIGTNDLSHIGNAMDVSARAAGAVVSFVVVAVLLLQTSVVLGLVVLLGVPVMLLALGPLLGPLQRRNLTQRSMMGDLSNLATDIVAGLRVLRGIGGERVFHDRYVRESQQVRRAGVEVGRLQSVLDAAQVALPGTFVVLVVWLGARLAVAGTITVGELVAFYGYAAFLMIPLRTATEAMNKWIRAVVAARRICTVLALEPDLADVGNPAAAPSEPSDLVDLTSGARVRSGLLTALVSDRPEETAEVVDRLGRFADGEVRWGEVPLDEVPQVDVRRRIVVSDTGSALFSGPLADQLDVRGTGDHRRRPGPGAARRLGRGRRRGPARRAALVGGRARSLLLRRPAAAARARPRAAGAAGGPAAGGADLGGRRPHRGPDRRAPAELRRGRTTVVTTTSPLLLDRADEVVFLVGGRVEATGRHRDLLADVAGYRAVVTREEEVHA